MGYIKMDLPDSTQIMDQPDKLRERYLDTGVLYFRNIIPREDILRFRLKIMEVFDRHGWLEPGHPLMEDYCRQSLPVPHNTWPVPPDTPLRDSQTEEERKEWRSVFRGLHLYAD